MSEKKDKIVEETIFHSTSKKHSIGNYKPEKRLVNGVIIMGESIDFQNWQYRTSDPKKIEFIKNNADFTQRKKIRIVTEEELTKLISARLPIVRDLMKSNLPPNRESEPQTKSDDIFADAKK